MKPIAYVCKSCEALVLEGSESDISDTCQDCVDLVWGETLLEDGQMVGRNITYDSQWVTIPWDGSMLSAGDISDVTRTSHSEMRQGIFNTSNNYTACSGNINDFTNGSSHSNSLDTLTDVSLHSHDDSSQVIVWDGTKWELQTL